MTNPRTPEQRSNDARIAVYSRWATTSDRAAATAPARRAFDRKFFDATDPDLPESVRVQQAEAAKRAYFLRLAKKSAKARQK